MKFIAACAVLAVSLMLVVSFAPSADGETYTEDSVIYISAGDGSVSDADAAVAEEGIGEIMEGDARAVPEVRVVAPYLRGYSLPADLMLAVEDANGILSLLTDYGNASFDSGAISGFALDGTEDVSVTLTETVPSDIHSILVGDGHSYRIHLEADGRSLDSEAGGDVAVTVPFSILRGYGPEDIVVYALEDGSFEGTPVENPSYFEADGRGFVTFMAPELTEYAVTYEEGSREAGQVTPASLAVSALGILMVSGMFYWMFRRM